MMSNAVAVALEAVATDSYPWVEFSFYPCPVGADTPAGCAANPGPFQMNPDCCVNDKFEACMVQQLQCFPNNTACNATLRLQMANFLSCFEGSTISEGQCPGNAQKCAASSGLGSLYPVIMQCVNNNTSMKAAAAAMDKVCTAEKVQSWPHVRIDGKLTCPDDPCMMPLLPKLCAAYKSKPKPASCRNATLYE